MIKQLLIWMLMASPLFGFAQESKSKWIWYPGDFELWLSNKVQTRRVYRDVVVPPFWRLDTHYPLVIFYKQVDLADSETVRVHAEGRYNISFNGGGYVTGGQQQVTIPKGKQQIRIAVYNAESPPSLLVSGKTIHSDSTWQLSAQDNRYVAPGSWTFDSPGSPPSAYKLATTPKTAVSQKRTGNEVLVDFGQETFGYVKMAQVQGSGTVRFYYGESLEEANDTASCETLDRFQIQQPSAADYTSPYSRAFRYVKIVVDEGIRFRDVSMQYEYLPLDAQGSFRCSDTTINKIWNVAAYTLHLNTREFFLDGIKRDRWLWSGDAYQSYLMNYYLFGDKDVVKRTTWALRGKDPVQTHINTILDYSYYWFMGIYDYYRYTGDRDFVKQVYPRMQSLMDFCLSRLDKEGMTAGLPGDWVFLDWAPMPKEGELSAEQLLLCRSMETMALCAGLLNDEPQAEKFRKLSAALQTKILKVFWDDQQQALVHSRENGVTNKLVTKYANMFALMFGYLNPEQAASVKNQVLLNPAVQKITTPYMRFYELEALCAIGEQNHVLDEIKSYWGGMLKLGATSFWEEYNPELHGADHYSMYGNPYGKSLCHAWGASPIFLLGKYYLGVSPEKAGYETYRVTPVLGGLQWMEGAVPTPHGKLAVYMDTKTIRITSIQQGKGILAFKSAKKPLCKTGAIKETADGTYEMDLEPGKSYEVGYRAVSEK